MREAMFYERLDRGRVRCTLCPHHCTIAPEHLGVCGVRFNHEGALLTLVDRRVVSQSLEPIEKKPLFHFHPGSTAYSIATVGCNLCCAFCQNWHISQAGKPGFLPAAKPAAARSGTELERALLRIRGEEVVPEHIVAGAVSLGARSIAYTFTEPTVFFELALETATRARAAGIKNVFVSNGFIDPEPLRQMARVLDAVNVDLKFPDDEGYRRISGARIAPILAAIRRYRELGVWVEVTSLLVTGVNDSDAQIRTMAGLVAAIDRDIPWHVSRFFPAWRMLDRGPTPVERIRRAVAIGRQAGLRYVYGGNVDDPGTENTVCPACGRVAIVRYGFRVLARHLAPGGRCAACGATLAGVGLDET